MASRDEEEEFGEDFRYVVRIQNQDLDGKRTLALALEGINGVGARLATILTRLSGYDPTTRIGDLSDEDTSVFEVLLEKLPDHIPPYLFNRQHDYYTGGDLHLYGQDLDLQTIDDINNLRKSRCYRGVRHDNNHRVRGQRTKSNGRSGLTLGVSRKKAK